MRPAQKAPENNIRREDVKNMDVTSMRPAQKAPENFGISKDPWTGYRHFNEAGAKSAGKLFISSNLIAM